MTGPPASITFSCALSFCIFLLTAVDRASKERTLVSGNFHCGLSSCTCLLTVFDRARGFSLPLGDKSSFCLELVDLMRLDIRDKVRSSSTTTGCRRGL